MKKKKVAMSLLVLPAEKKNIERIAKRDGTSQTAVIRELMRKAK